MKTIEQRARAAALIAETFGVGAKWEIEPRLLQELRDDAQRESGYLVLGGHGLLDHLFGYPVDVGTDGCGACLTWTDPGMGRVVISVWPEEP